MLPEIHPPTPGRQRIAFFDMDLTVLEENSARLWLRFERAEGRISRATALRGLWWMLLYRVGLVDMEKVTARVLELETGTLEEELIARCERWYARDVRPKISKKARARLQAHREAGDALVLLTASTRYGSGPLARELDLELVCTELEVADGRLTGRALPPLCYGEGKLARARAFAKARGIPLNRCWFYTDSVTDLPVLEAVGHPVVINADPPLRRLAKARGWPSTAWAGPG